MKISGIHEDDSMMGGKVLFELELEPEEVYVLDIRYLGYAFCEPYDGSHLWFWSQVGLDDALEDTAFWESIANAIDECGIECAPSGQELIQMAEDCLSNGNTEDFERRLD